jgi:hypothetical protein
MAPQNIGANIDRPLSKETTKEGKVHELTNPDPAHGPIVIIIASRPKSNEIILKLYKQKVGFIEITYEFYNLIFVDSL